MLDRDLGTECAVERCKLMPTLLKKASALALFNSLVT